MPSSSPPTSDTTAGSNRSAAEPTVLPTTAPPVLIHPPLLFVVIIALVGLLEWLMPIAWMTALPRLPLALVGGLAVIGGLMLGIAAALQMHRAGTNIPTFQPALGIVTDGVFAHSRNPIYLGLVTAMTGLALLWPSFWLLIGTGLTAFILHHGVIKREEAYLEQYFGAPYAAYCATTRRWYGRVTATG